MHFSEQNGGRVEPRPCGYRFSLSPQPTGYANAQLDDTHGRGRRHYLWKPPVHLTLRARFSHPAHAFPGTAGFGFWNAPFGDPSVPWPTLPQAIWFFLAAPPNNFPLAPLTADGAFVPGQGWFASTLDATRPRALALAPFALPTLLLNRVTAVRRHWWPFVRRQLSMSYHPLDQLDLQAWHNYELFWLADGSRFVVDGQLVYATPHAPRGPLGLVVWLDNQWLVVTAHGRVAWGTQPINEPYWLEIADLNLSATHL
jgi:hypothetical protein